MGPWSLLALVALSDPEAALESSAAALRAGDPAAAIDASRAALKASGQAKSGGETAARALIAWARAETARGDRSAAAARLVEALDHAVVPGRLRASILRDLGRARRAAKLPGGMVAELAKAETDVRRGLRRRGPPFTALEEAEETYRRHGQARRARWTEAKRRLLLARSGHARAARAGLARLQRARNPSVRAVAFEVEAVASLAEDKLRAAAIAAARAAIAADEAQGPKGPGPNAPRPLRPGRADPGPLRPGRADPGPLRPGPMLTRICDRFDESEGLGQCARAVHRTTGAWLARSAGKAVAARSAPDLEARHAEATAFLEDCLRAAVKNDPSLEGEALELSWVIDRHGEAIEPEIAPGRRRTLLDGCVGHRIGWLRYPPLVGGEHHTVRLGFKIGG